MNSTLDEKLAKYLIESEFLTQDQVENLKQKDPQKPFEEVLFESGLIKDEELGQLIAQHYGWSFIDLRKQAVDEKMLKLIPQKVAEGQQIIAIGEKEDGLAIAMRNPGDMGLIHMLEKHTGKKILPFFASPQSIREGLSHYNQDTGKRFEELIAIHTKEAAGAKAKESATVALVDLLIEHGYESKASDIHIEPQEENSAVRFRIDSVMKEIVRLPKTIHELIISRIKIMARMRTDEHQAPQDGKIQYDFKEEKVDIRTSVVPTTKGENAVLRLLSEKARQLSLNEMGYSKKSYALVREQINKPWGMILATGPTGSGKTSNLYSIMKILNKPEVNIATIEDPVEYNMDGITQIQVNKKAELTFSTGLRSIVRQDPDIILVGEIRDEETAGIAVNSAMTGHLVLSTLHTNDAATTLPRLLDMGIEPFLVASTVNVAIGQRLVRKICPKCIQSYEVHPEDLETKIPLSVIEKMSHGRELIQIYKGKGCALCHDTGYHGRTGIFEVLEMKDNIRELIMKNANADTIRNTAIKNGMKTMFDDALEKVISGVTTLDEMLRVIRE